MAGHARPDLQNARQASIAVIYEQLYGGIPRSFLPVLLLIIFLILMLRYFIISRFELFLSSKPNESIIDNAKNK